jgi:hypothetical protein
VNPLESTEEWAADIFESNEELGAFLADLRASRDPTRKGRDAVRVRRARSEYGAHVMQPSGPIALDQIAGSGRFGSLVEMLF